MREKVAWAAEHGFAAPEHARQLADAEAASAEKGDCPRCRIKATEHAGVRPTASWVLGIHQQKCHGEGHGGIFAQAPAVAPLPPVSWQPESGVTASVWIASAHLVSLAQVPPAPPPRG
jgi:hypothetical protein